MLEPMVRRPGIRAEGPAAAAAAVATPFSPLGLVEAVANDACGRGFSRQRAFSVCAAETLHCFWTAQRQDWSPEIES